MEKRRRRGRRGGAIRPAGEAGQAGPGSSPDAGGSETPPPGAGRFTIGIPPELAGLPLNEVKQILRTSNADLARELARFTGMTHREVNGQLNRLAGIGRIADATVDQLCKRADQAEKWMAAL